MEVTADDMQTSVSFSLGFGSFHLFSVLCQNSEEYHERIPVMDFTQVCLRKN